MKNIKNFISYPFNSKLFFDLYQKLLNKSSNGFILSFHDLSPQTFKSHIECLLPAKPIPLDELIKRQMSEKSNKNCFSITFDDGVEETVRNSWDVCLKHNWPVTFFLPVNYLNGENLPFQKIQLLEYYLKDKEYTVPKDLKKNKSLMNKKRIIEQLKKIIYYESSFNIKENINYFLKFLPQKSELKNYKYLMPRAISWDEVKKISKNDLSSFQSHGVSHTACSGLTTDELKNEMISSKDIIQKHTGKKVNGFCYPYGSPNSINQASIDIASKFFDYSTTLIKGRLTNKSILHYLPRIDLYEENKASLVKMKVAIS